MIKTSSKSQQQSKIWTIKKKKKEDKWLKGVTYFSSAQRFPEINAKSGVYAILGRRKQKVSRVRLVTAVHWLVSIQQGNGGIPQTVLTGLTRAGVPSTATMPLFNSGIPISFHSLHKIHFYSILGLHSRFNFSSIPSYARPRACLSARNSSARMLP